MNKKGFTLIELLVVIVILAIIALITVPNALAMITTAQERADARSEDGIRRAAEVYCLEQKTLSPGATVTSPVVAADLDYKGNYSFVSVVFDTDTCVASTINR